MQSRSNATPLAKLSSLLERDESPAGVQSNLDAVVATPVAPPNTIIPHSRFGMPASPIKTPKTASRLTFGETHLSKIQQSTTSSVGALSCHPVTNVSDSFPSKPTVAGDTQDTPSKSRPFLPKHMNSPTFDFSFERPESDLSVEAQKIMDNVREEAAKIKAQMLEERAKQEHEDGVTDQLYGVGARKIAKPKGKGGRFSDVHNQEFEKMDSIADHASTWKSKIQGSLTPSLKRSPSKAGLEEAHTLKSMTESKSMRSLHFSASDRLEDSSPGKRAKRRHGDDASTARPMSRDAYENLPKTPTSSYLTSNLPSAVTTPTKASLARSASVRDMRSSNVPSLCRTASTKTLGRANLNMPKTEGSNKYTASLSRFSGSMKSILYRAQQKYSDDPEKVATGTHLPSLKTNLATEKDLPSLPSSPSKDIAEIYQSPTIKRVTFSESTATGNPKLPASPSMSKIPKPRNANTAQPHTQKSAPSPPAFDPNAKVAYPLIATSPNITTRRPLPKPTSPGDFTFRAEQTINFSPSKVSSPGSTTIRVVRPSGLPTPMPGVFDVMPSIPHGMTNKKRKHDVDENEDVAEAANPGAEQHGPGEDEDEGQPRAKKRRMHIASPSVQAKENNQSPLKRRFGTVASAGSRIPKKGGMSLARLSALARPKERR